MSRSGPPGIPTTGPAPSLTTSAFNSLPDVEMVSPGLWSIPVPIPNNPLRYVLVYLFETDRGPYLVDAGWNADDSFDTLVAGLTAIGFGVESVQGVLVTHIHPDHYGLAGRIRAASGAWIGIHPADAELIKRRFIDPEGLIKEMAGQLLMLGVPELERRRIQEVSANTHPYEWAADPDILVEDGDEPDLPGWSVRAIWTPGHSPGHLCFYEDRRQLLLSGDHVLPRITPNISLHPHSGDNPLGQYLESLEKLKGYRVNGTLPAHEYRFEDLAGRIGELRLHHEARFHEVIQVIRDGSATAWEVAKHMRWSRLWSDLEGSARRAALNETFAHLRALERRGRLLLRLGEPLQWEIIEEKPLTIATLGDET